jgi:transposase
VSIQDLARAHGTSYGTISRILHSQLGLKGEWFLHWDNAPVHTAMVILEFLAKKRTKLLSHPPYSPDLTPADYLLLPKLKKEKGRASP